MDAIEKFHAHLDLCAQCREHPFDLCRMGAQLLVATAGPSKPYSMSASVAEPCDCDHELDEEHKANCKFWGSRLTPVTGRFHVEEPGMQNIPVRTKLGKQFREAFLKNFSGPIRILDTSGLEERLHEELHQHEKKQNCPLCAAGIPFKDN